MTQVDTGAPAPVPATAGPAPVVPPRPRRASRWSRSVARGPISVFLLAVALLWLVPTIGLFVASLRSATDNNTDGWWNALSAPSQLTLDNYRSLLENSEITGSLWNTAAIAIPATLLVVVLASMAAYAFAWIRFPGRDITFLIVTALLVVPIQVALIPVAGLFADLGIFGELSGVILFHVAFGLPFAIFLLRNFFAGVPAELLEAARLDGASERTLFLRVMLPLGIPAIASLAIFQFLWVWNDLLVALIFAGNDNKPITLAIREQTRQFGTNIDVIAPGAFLSMIVPLAVFFAFQRYFVQGLLAGSQR